MRTIEAMGRGLLLAALLGLAATAQAKPLLSYQNGGGCTMSTACYDGPEVEGSQLLSNLPKAYWANGYIADDPWSLGVNHDAPAPVFTLRVKAVSDVRLDDFAFSLFNNDCQIVRPANCSGANWALSLALNDGDFGAPVYQFNSGGTFNDLHASVKLDQFLQAGDRLALRIRYLNGIKDPTGQYFFHDVALHGGAPLPEPASLALAGAAGLALLLTRRRSGHAPRKRT